MAFKNNKFIISLFFKTASEPKVQPSDSRGVTTMFIFPRPLFPVATALGLLLLLVMISVMSGG